MKIGSRPLWLWISTTASTATAARYSSNAAASGRSRAAFVPHHRTPVRSPSTLRMSSSDSSAPSTLRVALCQFPVTHHKDINHQTAKDYLTKAKEKGAKMAVLPEIWNSPYATAAFPEYAEILPEIGDSTAESSASAQLLMDAAKEHGMWVVGGSVPERVLEHNEEKIYNTCLVLNPEGTIVAKHRKVHLFDIDVPGGITFFESETLSPGSTVSHFSTPFGEIGVGVCYDIRFAEYALLLRQKYNCVILVYPGAFNMTTGPAHWQLLQQARAIDNQCFVLTASPARKEKADESSTYPHYTAWGHSTVVSPWGDIVATTNEKADIVIADLDLSRLQEVRNGIPIGTQRRADLYTLDHSSK